MSLTYRVPRHRSTDSFLLRIWAVRHLHLLSLCRSVMLDLKVGQVCDPLFQYVQRNWLELKLRNERQQVQNPFCNFLEHLSSFNFGERVWKWGISLALVCSPLFRRTTKKDFNPAVMLRFHTLPSTEPFGDFLQIKVCSDSK